MPIVKSMKHAQPVTFSLDAETLQAIDDARAQLGTMAPGMRVGRSDALRVLVRRALAAGRDNQ